MTEAFQMFIRRFLGDSFVPKCVYEVGAYDAAQGLELHKAWEPSPLVVCFEPNPRMIPAAMNVVRQTADMRLVPMAVGLTDGVVDFYQNIHTNPACSSIIQPSGEYDHVEKMPYVMTKVPITRLDTFIEQSKTPPPEVMWIDAQGSDLEVLMSLGKYINNVKAIWTEIEYGRMYKDQYLRDDQVKWCESVGLTLVEEVVTLTDGAGVKWWGDACFIRK